MRALMLVLGAVVAAAVALSAQAGARALIFTPGSYDFGSVAVGASATYDFTLSYTGKGSSDTITVTLTPKSTSTYTSPFTIITNGCRGKSLTAKTTCEVTVSYSPSAAGATDTATLKATSQDQPLRSNSVTLTGSGSAAGADIALTYDSTTHTVTATNNGPLAATVTVTVTAPGTWPACRIGSVGADAADWTQTQSDYCQASFVSVAPIASGSSLSIFLYIGFYPDGTASVTQSSQPDPNTANNSVAIPAFGTIGPD